MPSTRQTRLAASVAAAAALALAPAAASATSFFGSSLNHDPANAGTPCNENFSSAPPNCTHVGSFYPGTSGHAKAGSGGTITKIRIRPQGPMKMHFELVRVRHLSSNKKHGQARVIFQSHVFNVPGPSQSQLDSGTYPIRTIHADIPVSKGDELAITTKKNEAEYCSDGTPGQLTFFNPVLSIGHPFRTNTSFDGCLLLVQAVIKH